VDRFLPDFSCRKRFCKLTFERKTGTPEFQKTVAKKIKIFILCYLTGTVFKKLLFLSALNRQKSQQK